MPEVSSDDSICGWLWRLREANLASELRSPLQGPVVGCGSIDADLAERTAFEPCGSAAIAAHLRVDLAVAIDSVEFEVQPVSVQSCLLYTSPSPRDS